MPNVLKPLAGPFRRFFDNRFEAIHRSVLDLRSEERDRYEAMIGRLDQSLSRLQTVEHITRASDDRLREILETSHLHRDEALFESDQSTTSAVSDESRFAGPFIVADVGARWGVAERWAALGPNVKVIGFDPDSGECDRLNALAAAEGDFSVTYVPVALGSSIGEVALYNTVDPACSSIYPAIARVSEAFPELTCTTAAGEQRVSMTTLDRWCADHSVERIDALKLDTQGSELGVLEGATGILSSVQVLEIEVEFNPIYSGQPLFGDVDAFLRRRGFALWRLDNLIHYSSGDSGNTPRTLLACYDSVPIDSPARGGQLYWCHAYFVRSELCPGAVAPASESQRRRAALIADAAGLADLASYLR